jgi:TIR domain.
MASDLIVRQRQRELTQLRTELSRATDAIASARGRAAKASSAARGTKSEATRRQKIAEAAREEQRANDAEKKRSQIEKRIADKEKSLFEAQRRYESDRERENKRALDSLNSSLPGREARFHPSPVDVRLVRDAADQRNATAIAADVFISHASEDKDEIARPLAEALQARGVSIWFDELSIGWGQPIHRAIEEGIANARFGLVIISTKFMEKHWTQAELDGLYGRQMGQPDGSGIILPVWHRVTADEVQSRLPMIAALKALNTGVSSVEDIADEVARLVQGSRP